MICKYLSANRWCYPIINPPNFKCILKLSKSDIEIMFREILEIEKKVYEYFFLPCFNIGEGRGEERKKKKKKPYKHLHLFKFVL